jgi:hypothetical protein
MPLDAVRDLLESAAYLPASVRFQMPSLWPSLSAEARFFVWIATDKQSEGLVTFDEMYGRVWADDRMTSDAFDKLPDEAKAEVLALFTFEIHELTHHIDFLITPYGVNFHSKLMREYNAFRRFVPPLLREGTVPDGRLIDYELRASSPGGPSDTFLSSWRQLHDISGTLEALGDGGMAPRKSYIAPGWGNDTKPIMMLGQSLQRLTVRNFLPTLGVPEEPGWYLRPSTIFETRALVHCLSWIFKLFGKDERARAPMQIYLDSFYPRESIAPDYRFVIDLIASGWGENFHDFVAKADILMVKQVLMIADLVCWYALQAPPPMPGASAIRSSPPIRFIYALRFIARSLKNKTFYPSAAEAMAAMDEMPEAEVFDLRPISESLRFCIEFIAFVREMNRRETESATFRGHFAHVQDVQERQISKRLDVGYATHIGMPEDGHPVFGLSREQDVVDLAFKSYVPDPQVPEWFSFRYDFMYRYSDSGTATELLSKFFGPH